MQLKELFRKRAPSIPRVDSVDLHRKRLARQQDRQQEETRPPTPPPTSTTRGRLQLQAITGNAATAFSDPLPTSCPSPRHNTQRATSPAPFLDSTQPTTHHATTTLLDHASSSSQDDPCDSSRHSNSSTEQATCTVAQHFTWPHDSHIALPLPEDYAAATCNHPTGGPRGPRTPSPTLDRETPAARDTRTRNTWPAAVPAPSVPRSRATAPDAGPLPNAVPRRTMEGRAGAWAATDAPVPGNDCPELHDLASVLAGMAEGSAMRRPSYGPSSRSESPQLDLLARPDSLIIAKSRWARAGLEAKAQGRRGEQRAGSALGPGGADRHGRTGRRGGAQSSTEMDAPRNPSARYLQDGVQHGGKGASRASSPWRLTGGGNSRPTSPSSRPLAATSGGPHTVGLAGRAAATSGPPSPVAGASARTATLPRPSMIERLKALLLSPAPAPRGGAGAAAVSRTGRHKSAVGLNGGGGWQSLPQAGGGGGGQVTAARLLSSPAGMGPSLDGDHGHLNHHTTGRAQSQGHSLNPLATTAGGGGGEGGLPEATLGSVVTHVTRTSGESRQAGPGRAVL